MTDRPMQSAPPSLLFPSASAGNYPENSFRSLNVQKIGNVAVKGSDLDVYNVYAQVVVCHTGGDARRNVIVTLGNLNAGGVTV